MIKTSHTLLTLNNFQKNTLDYICDIYTKVKHTGFKLIAQSNVGLFKNNLLNKSNYQIDEKPRIIKIENKHKLEIYTKSKVYLLDYIVNSNITEDKSNNYNRHDNNLNEWSVISNLYKSLQKDIYKEKLHNKKLNLELNSLMESAPAPSDGLDLSYLFSGDNLQEHDTQ